MSIITKSELRNNMINDIKSKLEAIGGYVKLDKAIRFKQTPHSPIKWINEISIDDDFDSMGNELNAIRQRVNYYYNQYGK